MKLSGALLRVAGHARWLRLAALVLGACPAAWAGTVTFALDPAAGVGVIDPLAYGGNHHDISFVPFRRFGGNRATSYNWEGNQSNAGSDFNHQSDYWLLSQVGLPANGSQPTAAVPVTFVDQFRAAGSTAELVTIQAAGYVAADAAGIVSAGETAPSARWRQVLAHKPGWPGTLLLAPNKVDGVVYMDEQVNYLVNQFGPASAGGIKYYSVDNEPGLWSSTHLRLHPANATYAEAYLKASSTAAAILDIDPSAGIFAPASYGWAEFQSMQFATDASANNATYGWFLAYFLDKMRQSSVAAGRRMLHFLDLHWYPEATGGGTRICFGNPDTTTQVVSEARMQAPRSLWDTTYVESSWITSSLPAGDKPIRLIPRVKASIATYYPGTRLALTEYNYGAGSHISGGIAHADVLGILGRYGVAGNYWHLNGGKAYIDAACRLYLNYDGAGAKFGDLSFAAQTTDKVYTSVYAAKDTSSPDRLTVVVLNKNWSTSVSGAFNLTLSAQSIQQIRAWRFSAASATLAPLTPPAFTSDSFSDTLPATSATLYEILLSSLGSPTPTPTASRTFSRTPTGTPSRTATSSRTITGSPTPSGSATRSPTTTPSSSPTASRTASPTPSATPTASDVPTRTATPSVTGSASPSSTATETATAVPPGSTQTSTATPTPSLSSTATRTATPSASTTATATTSFTSAPSASSTATRTATPSASITAAATASFTSTLSASSTATRTTTPSASTTAAITASPTPTATAALAAAGSPPATAADASQALQVDELLGLPNPGPTALAVRVRGRCDILDLELFSAAMTKLARAQAPGGTGWLRVSLPDDWLNARPGGLYYARVTAQGPGGRSTRTTKLVFTR